MNTPLLDMLSARIPPDEEEKSEIKELCAETAEKIEVWSSDPTEKPYVHRTLKTYPDGTKRGTTTVSQSLESSRKYGRYICYSDLPGNETLQIQIHQYYHVPEVASISTYQVLKPPKKVNQQIKITKNLLE